MDHDLLLRRGCVFGWALRWQPQLGDDLTRVLMLLAIGAGAPECLSPAGHDRVRAITQAIDVRDASHTLHAVAACLLAGGAVPEVPPDKAGAAVQALLDLMRIVQMGATRDLVPALVSWPEVLAPAVVHEIAEVQAQGRALEQVLLDDVRIRA